ncbi:MAG TPA: hypothetical protein VMG35_28705 [Bryobacteraceae bacterium]|nr:hypothetical protein [Bryobacteraceae bacterium]
MAARLTGCLWCCVALELVLGSGALAQLPVRKIRQKMSDTLNSTPDFMCAVSLERSERDGKEPAPVLPGLQVKAGIISGKEMYLLPSTEGDQAILKKVLAVYNRAGTGTFALYARAVFLTAAATFYDGPEETKDGRVLSHLDFAMPREVSHYALNNGGQPLPTGYSGTIWTDPHNQEVAKLLLQADNIPAAAGLKAITQTFDYSHANIGGVSTLLPSAMDLTVQEAAGPELRITAHFSDCSSYVSKRGEQFVENRLAEPVTETGHASAVIRSSTSTLPSIEELLPAKSVFEMILQDPIDERSTTEGSRLSFVVSREVKRDGKVVLPKGAIAKGHVTRLLRQTYVINTSVKAYYLIGIQIDTIEVQGHLYQIWANLESVGPPATQICFVPLSHDPAKWGDYYDLYTLFAVPNAERGESFLGVVDEYLRLGSHWRTDWMVLHLP